MSDNTSLADLGLAKVVHLAQYRAERAQRDLPLFARPAETSACPELAVARPLQPREVAHRERMLQFLRSTS
jgi:hypothetical protein